MMPSPRPLAIKVKINEKEIVVPQCWTECNTDLAARLAQHLNNSDILFEKANLDAHERLFTIKIMLTAELLGLNMKDIADYSQTEQDAFIGKITNLIQISNWMFVNIKDEDGNDTKSLQVNYSLLDIKNKLEIIETCNARLFSPDDNGYNLLFNEFTAADNAFVAYTKATTAKSKESALNLLCAILFRPKVKFSDKLKRGEDVLTDIRIPFNASLPKYAIQPRLAIFADKDFPAKLKHLILFFWASYRQYLIREYPLVWEGGGQPHPYGWDAVLMALSNDSLVHEEIVGAKPCSAVFFTLNMQEYNRRDQEMKNQLANA